MYRKHDAVSLCGETCCGWKNFRRQVFYGERIGSFVTSLGRLKRKEEQQKIIVLTLTSNIEFVFVNQEGGKVETRVCCSYG